MRQNFFNHTQLLGFVVDNEIALVTELLNVLSQDPHAQRVKRANGRSLGFLAFISLARLGWPGAVLYVPLDRGFIQPEVKSVLDGWASAPFFSLARNKFGNPCLHFSCSLVGKRDCQNVSRPDATLDEVGDSICNHPRLAGACARQD